MVTYIGQEFQTEIIMEICFMSQLKAVGKILQMKTN